MQEDATEHVGAVLQRVKHEYLVSTELPYTTHPCLCVLLTASVSMLSSPADVAYLSDSVEHIV